MCRRGLTKNVEKSSGNGRKDTGSTKSFIGKEGGRYVDIPVPRARTLTSRLDIKATNPKTGEIEGKLLVPFRPHLFGKQPPVMLELSRTALSKDEVFLILAMIYLEAKRQEKMVSIIAFLKARC